MAKPIILDVDTGIDDALAIAYALRSPELKLEAVTTTYGNIDLASATRNTLQILESWGATEVPVYAGAARPLTRPYRDHPSTVHGPNGMGGVELAPAKRSAEAKHAIDYLIEVSAARPGELTLVATGPLTNLAMALLQDPDVARRFAEIVIMGGAIIHPGNATPTAEANILSDPEAARAVFHAGGKITLVGLDVTMQTLLTPEAIAEMERSQSAACRDLGSATRFYLGAYQRMYPGISGCGMHDPLAVAVAADPTLVGTQAMYVDVETRGEISRGQTVGDRRFGAKATPNMNVCLTVDAPRFIRTFLERLGAEEAK